MQANGQLALSGTSSLLSGPYLPPVTLYLEHPTDGSRSVWVLDGSQRTHVPFLDALIAQNIRAILANYEWMQTELEKLKAQGKEALSYEELMAQPAFLQIWSDLASPSPIVRLFLLLNAGQQKFSSRHLLEVLGRQLQNTAGLNAGQGCSCCRHLASGCDCEDRTRGLLLRAASSCDGRTP
jgi:hypothetical protein